MVDKDGKVGWGQKVGRGPAKVKKEDGKREAEAGCYDDEVMAFGICLQMVLHNPYWEFTPKRSSYMPKTKIGGNNDKYRAGQRRRKLAHDKHKRVIQSVPRQFQ